MQVTYLRHDNDHPRGIRALTRLSIFDWEEGFVGMWVLGIVSQYIVRLHRVTMNTTETSS